jgi:hypothetical protein
MKAGGTTAREHDASGKPFIGYFLINVQTIGNLQLTG